MFDDEFHLPYFYCMYDMNRAGQIYKIFLGVIVHYQIIWPKQCPAWSGLPYSIEMFSLSVLHYILLGSRKESVVYRSNLEMEFFYLDNVSKCRISHFTPCGYLN